VRVKDDMNILLTSAGRRTYLIHYFRAALNGRGRVHASNSEYSPALQQADEFVITPLIYDPGYVNFLLEYCIKHDISAIVPLFDVGLPVLSQAKRTFMKHGIQVIVSDYSVTQICNDKWKTKQFLDKNGLTGPVTFPDIHEAKKGVGEGRAAFPLIIKPRWGMGSIGIYSAGTMDELDVLYRKAVKTIFNSYLSYESMSDRSRCVIIQEKIEGTEFGLDVVNDLNREYAATFVKEKNGMRSGETDAAKTVHHPGLEQTGKKLSQSLKHIGNLDVDCIILEDRAYVLDMNCRLGGGYPFSHLAGANVPAAMLAWIEGRPADKDHLKVEYGIQGIKDIVPCILKNYQGNIA